MTFNSLTFIIFFLGVLSLYHLPFSWKGKKRILLFASYLFYSAWNPPFVVLLWISTVVDWYAVKFMGRSSNQKVRKFYLFLSLLTNLGLLSFFKYGNFLLANFVGVLHLFGIQYSPPEMSILLPMGISFYTFQSMSYTIDVYRKASDPWDSFLDFALYVTFFPQLVAGPIIRAGDFLPQCLHSRKATLKQLGWGLCLITIGLFQKNILSDLFFAPVVDEIYGDPYIAGFYSAWIGTLAFSGQIFCDFSGYSLCGVGAALCLGFSIPDNFRFPYAAVGFSDFWRRWHMSLSGWLRDYLYIPLGGNQKGQKRKCGNLLMTMLIGGLWHGAAWRFVFWGFLHGGYLMAEEACKKRFSKYPIFSKGIVQFGLALLTYVLVCFAWVFFRAKDFSSAFHILSAMVLFFPESSFHLELRYLIVLVLVVFLLISHWLMRKKTLEEVIGKMPFFFKVAFFSSLLLGIILLQTEDRSFIYFQF